MNDFEISLTSQKKKRKYKKEKITKEKQQRKEWIFCLHNYVWDDKYFNECSYLAEVKYIDLVYETIPKVCL